MFPYVALAKDKTWQPGPYEGVELMVLHKNPDTGGVVVLRKFKAGYTIPAHTHPLANELAYVLSVNGRKRISFTRLELCFMRRRAPGMARTSPARKSSA
ncbi:MAG: hypothetical protein WDN00_11180 [Limisphaerales bacterium]